MTLACPCGAPVWGVVTLHDLPTAILCEPCTRGLIEVMRRGRTPREMRAADRRRERAAAAWAAR